jgi:hypothetical protein
MNLTLNVEFKTFDLLIFKNKNLINKLNMNLFVNKTKIFNIHLHNKNVFNQPIKSDNYYQ